MTVQEKYNEYNKGNISKEKLIYELRRDPNLTQYITSITSFDDSISILKHRGVITEAKIKPTELTLDQSNPYELKKGMEYELDLCYKPTPNAGLTTDDYSKTQKKVLTNLAKDPSFYTKTIAGLKPDGELESNAQFGLKMNRPDVVTQVKDENYVDKKNASKEAAKLAKSNVSDTLGQKEKAKHKNPKGIKLMTMIPKKLKGVKVMDMPGKEKKIKLKEGLEENIPASTASMVPFAQVKPGMTATDDSGESFKILATGDYTALKRYDSSGTMNKFLSSDPTGIDGNQLVALMDGEGNTLLRVYGTGGVYVYKNGTEESALIVKPNSPESDPNNLKKYTDKGYDVRLDPTIKEFEDEEEEPEQVDKRELFEINILKHNAALKDFIARNNIHAYNKMSHGKPYDLVHISDDGKMVVSEIYNWGRFGTKHDDRGNVVKEVKEPFSHLNESENFESNIMDKQIPQNNEELAAAKAAILVVITKAHLEGKVDLESDVAVKGGYIWVRIRLGTESLSNEQLKALCSEGKFKGLNPVSNTEITLIFDKK